MAQRKNESVPLLEGEVKQFVVVTKVVEVAMKTERNGEKLVSNTNIDKMAPGCVCLGIFDTREEAEEFEQQVNGTR